MSRQRKQKLSSRFNEEETMEQNRDPFFNLTKDESMGDEVFPSSDFLETFTEPSMPPGWNENTDWLLDEPASLLSEELLDVNSILGLDDTGLSFLGDDTPSVQNKETFQDLRCTSTPKSRSESCLDSGIAECSSSFPLKPKTQKTVLHDITDSNKFNIQSANDSFININEVVIEANTPKAIRNKKKPRADFAKCKRSIPIIKKKPNVFVTPSSSQKTPSEDDLKSREQLMYYSGLNLYEKALGIAKYINLPASKLSTYKMVLLTFMKLRLDLEWVDIAYRYEIDTKTAQSVFLTALNILSVSLVDLLPWQTPKHVNNRTIPKKFYTFVTETSFGKVLTLISELSPPILFVTPLYDCSESSSLLIYLECGARFIPGDIICISNPLEFYKVSNENNQLVFTQINPQDLPFLQEAQNVVSNLSKYALSDPSRLTDDVDIAKVMLVSAALTNFNYLKTADTNVLARIYQRSATYLHSEV